LPKRPVSYFFTAEPYSFFAPNILIPPKSPALGLIASEGANKDPTGLLFDSGIVSFLASYRALLLLSTGGAPKLAKRPPDLLESNIIEAFESLGASALPEERKDEGFEGDGL